MRSLFKCLCVSVTLSLALLFLRPTPARADDVAAKAPLTQVGFVAGKSVDALTAFANLLSIPVPPNFSVDGIEQQLPFIGKGGLVTDQPLGLAFVGGPDVKDPEQAMVFVLPVKPTAATLEALKAQGGKALDDHPDTVVMGGVALRRTADYLLFSPNPAAVSAVNIASIADAVKSGDALVKVSLDIKAARQSMPEQYKQLLDNASSAAFFGTDKATGFSPLLKILETIDRFETRLDNGEKGIRLAFTATPFKLPALTATNKPGMPPGVIGRIDWGVSIGDAFPAFKDGYAALINKMTADPKDKARTPEEKQKIESVTMRVMALYMDPTAMSVGVEMVGGEPVVYITQHWSKRMDVSKEIQELVAAIKSLDKDAAASLEVQTHQSHGERVLRIVAMENGKPQGCLDVVQKGDDVYMTVAPNLYGYVHHLFAAKDEGPLTSVYSGSLDLGKLITVMSTGDGAPLSGMPADKHKQLLDLLAGQKINLATVTEPDGGATIEITADKALVRSAPKLAAAFGLTEMADRTKDIVAANNAKQILMGCFLYAADQKGAWPDTLDQIADSVGGKDALAKLMTDPRGGTFVYRKPADPAKDAEKTIALYETFPGDATHAKVAVGYGDGHVTTMDATQLKAVLGDGAPK